MQTRKTILVFAKKRYKFFVRLSAFTFVLTLLVTFSVPNYANAYNPEDPQQVYKAAADAAKKINQTQKNLDGVSGQLESTKKKVEKLEKYEIPAATKAFEVASANFKDATEKKERIDRRYNAAIQDKERIEKLLWQSTIGLDQAKLALASSARDELKGNQDIQSAQIILDSQNSSNFVDEVETNEAVSRTSSRLLNLYATQKATSLNKEERLKIVTDLITELKKESDEAEAIAHKANDEATAWKNRVETSKRELDALKKDLEVKEKDLAALLKKEKEDQEIVNGQMAALAARDHNFDGSGGFISWPIDNRGITSPYGPRNLGSGFHNGIDFGYASCYDRIYAAAAGMVVTAGFPPYYLDAGVITIDHGAFQGTSWITQYLHMWADGIYVYQGQWVNRGQVIGAVGSSGYSTGCHLHFTVYKNGQHINPLSVLG